MTVTTGTSSGNSTWNWRVAARCRTDDGDGLFVSGAAQREVRGFCFACPVRTECLAYALDEQIEFGIWGGATERERRAMLRARPNVRSWADLLAEARLAHYTAEAASIRAAATAAEDAAAGTLPAPVEANAMG